MRCAERCAVAVGFCLLLASQAPGAQTLSPIHGQRFAMGTMFDVIVYHPSRGEAQGAIERALQEVVRLDRVLSNFKPDSELSRLVRDGRNGFVAVEPSLYEVIEQSLLVSRRSGGKFDVTIAALSRVWEAAQASGRAPSAAEIAGARRCVGYDKIEMSAPNRIRLHSDCVEIDLGGIGKGYAVDRAIAALRDAGIRDALVNAGSSSIGAIGSPPGGTGWPVDMTGPVAGSRILRLRDGSISTSQQSPSGGILDPQSGAPAANRLTVSVLAPSATVSDALSTAVLLLPQPDGVKLLEQFPGVSALWTSEGATLASYRESSLSPSTVR